MRLIPLFFSFLAYAVVFGEESGQREDESVGSSEEVKVYSRFETVEDKWNFDPKDLDDRRDPLYDLLSLIRAEDQQERARAQKTESGGTEAEIVVDPGQDESEVVLQAAQMFERRVSNYLRQKNWEETIKEADRGISELQPKVSSNKELEAIIVKLRGYRKQAEDAQIFEQAKTAFHELQLEVEGILWSAEEADQSRAIISGEIYSVQDRVRDCLIVNIDVNRVDFMFTFQRRRFEFIRYIGDTAR